MDYEAIDRDMSSWVVACDKNDVRLYLTEEGLATDILSRAERYRWEDRADQVSEWAREDEGWRGFDWHSASVAGESSRARLAPVADGGGK